MKKFKIALFASGNGSNTINLLRYFNGNKRIKVETVLSNNANAGVIEKCKSFGLEPVIFHNDSFKVGDDVLAYLKSKGIDYIILAGFLRKIPSLLIDSFPNKIINLHPSLLPKFGGKGMYGRNVHEAVSLSGDMVTGITIHTINTNYDEGDYIAQFYSKIQPFEEIEVIEKKIRTLELTYLPVVVENYIMLKNIG